MRIGTKGEAARLLQKDLMALGHDLPRYGADGSFGAESWSAMEDFARDIGFDLGPNEALDSGPESDALAIAVGEAAATLRASRREGSSVLLGLGEDLTLQHRGVHRKGARSVKLIDAIVLHQTAYVYPNEALWKTLRAHIGVPMDAGSGWLLVNPIEQKMYHANSFNTRSVGIEIEGNMAGIEGDRKTWWPPPASVKGDRRGPHTASDDQIRRTRDAVRYVVEKTDELGGKIGYIFAHRQSSKDRIADPGSRIWQEVGVWAQKEFGLSDGGPLYISGHGRPLPDEWTGEKRGVPYFS